MRTSLTSGIAFRRTAARRDLRAACHRAPATTHPPAAIPDQPLRSCPVHRTVRMRRPAAVAKRDQMLLHEHPVNLTSADARAALPTVVVFLGRHAAAATARRADMHVRERRHRRRAAGARERRRPLASGEPRTPHSMMRSRRSSSSRLRPMSGLTDIERSWAAPAAMSLVAGRLGAVSILAYDAGDAVLWHARPPAAGATRIAAAPASRCRGRRSRRQAHADPASSAASFPMLRVRCGRDRPSRLAACWRRGRRIVRRSRWRSRESARSRR